MKQTAKIMAMTLALQLTPVQAHDLHSCLRDSTRMFTAGHGYTLCVTACCSRIWPLFCLLQCNYSLSRVDQTALWTLSCLPKLVQRVRVVHTDWVAGEGAAAGGKGYTGASGTRRALAW